MTGLIALVAILGTTVYFMSENTFFTQKLNQTPQQENTSQNSQNNQETTDDSVSIRTESIKISNVHSWVSSNTMLQECEQLGIPAASCTDDAILAKKRLLYASGTVQTQVTSVTAFAIQNTGSTQASVKSIAFRGLSVPQENWYSCNPSACGTSANINTQLTADYNPNDGVALASGVTAFTSGAISLNSGQATIVYLVNAGDMSSIDAGNVYSLQVQAGQATAVQQVQVISTS